MDGVKSFERYIPYIVFIEYSMAGLIATAALASRQTKKKDRQIVEFFVQSIDMSNIYDLNPGAAMKTTHFEGAYIIGWNACGTRLLRICAVYRTSGRTFLLSPWP